MVDAEDNTRGVLVDFDLTHRNEDRPQPPTSRHRTGTLPFLALDLLQDTDGYPHYHRHDVESFYYVLVWTAGQYNEGVEKTNTSVFQEWCGGTWTSMYNHKFVFLGGGYNNWQPSHAFLRDIQDSKSALWRTQLGSRRS